jgi:catechol 2,3-dioxygenase-like lactoylglutathione lyase family enzyme
MADRSVQHITWDLAGSTADARFYRSVLAELDLPEHVDDHGRVSFGPDGDFGFYERGSRFFERTHVAFMAPSREAVDRFHAAAVGAGGATVDAPRWRPEFDASFYSVYVTDPAGRLVEALFVDGDR